MKRTDFYKEERKALRESRPLLQVQGRNQEDFQGLESEKLKIFSMF